MTLGGLALAVGILVDDATVTIENIERHMRAGGTFGERHYGRRRRNRATRVGLHFLYLHCFYPDVLSFRSRALPVCAVCRGCRVCSHGFVHLSRTLVPTLVMWFERNNHKEVATATPSGGGPGEDGSSKGGIRLATASPSHGGRGGHVVFWLRPFVALQQYFEHGFDLFRASYRNLLGTILNHRAVFAVAFLTFCAGSWVLVPFLGQDFFPTVDAGTFRLHVRAAAGTRVEETAKPG